MSREEMFIKATRSKARFPYKGLIGIEDLWDLPVYELDKIFKTLNAKVKQTSEESLLEAKTSEDEELSMQIEIIKYIVSVKLEEKKVKENAAAKKAQKQKIMAIIAEKQDKVLHDSSIDDLQKMLDELEA